MLPSTPLPCLLALRMLQMDIAAEILREPTGRRRNAICDANILIGKAIDILNELPKREPPLFKGLHEKKK